MKINLNFIFALMGALILGLIVWNVYLLNNISELQKENYLLKENYQDLDAFNEILKYDRETSRDSVRILEEKIKNY